MGSKWKCIPLRELITLQRGHDLPSQDRESGKIPIMGSSGLTGWHNVAKCPGPGVVIGRSGNSMGVVSYSEVDYWPLNTCLYVTDFKGNDEVYIYYMLQQIDFDQFNSGSAQKSLNRNAVYPYEVTATTDINEQKRIGSILSDLENKIRINQKINQTLEQMAQTLFKSWFVDFDPIIDNALDADFFEQDLAFPEELLRRVEVRKAARENSNFKSLPEDIRELFPAAFEECAEPSLGLGGWMPEGWFYSSIYEVMDIIFGAPFKSKLFNDSGEGKPIIRIRDLKTGEPKIFSVEQHAKKTLIMTGDIITGMDAEFRATIWSGDEAYLNQRLFLAKPKDSNVSNLFVKYSLDPLLAKEEMAQVGTTVAHIGKKDIDKFNIILPNQCVLVKFKNQSDDLLKKIVIGMKEIKMLTNLRDTLLPKLISGELSLSDIKIDSVGDALA